MSTKTRSRPRWPRKAATAKCATAPRSAMILHALEKWIARLRKAHGPEVVLRVCYEAGPCGFGIARRLKQLGVDCVVVAPSMTPTRSGDRIKTDKRDARKLARLLRSGELTAVYIPESTDEAIRDLCRARPDAVDDRRRRTEE